MQPRLGVLSQREAREALHRPFRVADEANRPRGQPKPCRDAALAAAATTIPAAATAIITAAAAATTTAATTAAAPSSAACGRCLRSAVLEDVAQCGGQVCRRLWGWNELWSGLRSMLQRRRESW